MPLQKGCEIFSGQIFIILDRIRIFSKFIAPFLFFYDIYCMLFHVHIYHAFSTVTWFPVVPGSLLYVFIAS